MTSVESEMLEEEMMIWAGAGDEFSFVHMSNVHGEDKKYDSFKVC